MPPSPRQRRISNRCVPWKVGDRTEFAPAEAYRSPDSRGKHSAGSSRRGDRPTLAFAPASLQWRAKLAMAALISDVEDAQRALRASEQRLRASHAVAEILANAPSKAAAMPAVLEAMGTAL